MSTLGIGVRVYVGWCPDSVVHHAAEDKRRQTGVIYDGPFPPGRYRDSGGYVHSIEETSWNVEFDGGGTGSADESILWPIDDNNKTQERENETTLSTV